MMDEGKPPKELIYGILITIAAISVPLFLFPSFNSLGIFLILGIATFMFLFSIIDKRTKKQEEEKFFKEDNFFFNTKHKLSKEIP